MVNATGIALDSRPLAQSSGVRLAVQHLLHDGEPPGADPHAVVAWGPGVRSPRLPDRAAYRELPKLANVRIGTGNYYDIPIRVTQPELTVVCV